MFFHSISRNDQKVKLFQHFDSLSAILNFNKDVRPKTITKYNLDQRINGMVQHPAEKGTTIQPLLLTFAN